MENKLIDDCMKLGFGMMRLPRVEGTIATPHSDLQVREGVVGGLGSIFLLDAAERGEVDSKRTGRAYTDHKVIHLEDRKRRYHPQCWCILPYHCCPRNEGGSGKARVLIDITWFSFAGEFAGDYPACLDGRPAQTTIEAMMPSRVLRVTGEQMLQMFRQNMQTMELRSVVGELILRQHRACYLDLHRATARERYELLLRRCPGIVHHLALQDLASFLCVTPNYLSTIRKDITFEAKK